MKADRRRPDERQRRRGRGRTLALALAIVVHAVFIGFLVWSVRWQSRPPEPVTAELYAAPQKIRAPDPEPKPAPAPEPKPVPPPPPPPPQKVEPDAAEIALKAKREEERRAKEKSEREKKLADDKRAAETKERLARETEAMREAAEREARDRAAAMKARADAEKAKADAETKARAEAEAKARADAERAKAEAEAKAKAQAEVNARSAAQADWVRRIQAKIRGNVVLPPDLPGNPEAVFEVIQLPTGEILETQLRKSSGVRSYDEAVQRAIVKSSPLPRPDRPDLFSRTLTLRFRPLD